MFLSLFIICQSLYYDYMRLNFALHVNPFRPILLIEKICIINEGTKD